MCMKYTKESSSFRHHVLKYVVSIYRVPIQIFMVDDLEDVLKGYPDFIGKDEPLGSFVSDPSA